ncbi:MAG: ABC transporter permease [Gammaproteobacteria bacterium]|jgi:ABC-2 type transport system permease protein|nr:ABC transporter permease [Gammaproteobacteria bacterium]MCP4881364.1 ABC transporter permease [Gammaproteobacteria bacterium]MDP6165114.1 ABC transporter permease [Gammaproteobacteria bacterium]
MTNYEIYISWLTIVRKEIQRFMRIWVQTLIPPSITMVLYFIIFGNLIGTRIGEMGGFTYMQFVVPGLIMMSVITNSYSNVVSSFYSTKYQGNLEEMLVSPTPNWVILTGYVAGGVARGLAVGTIVTTLSLFFTDLNVHNFAIIAVVVLMTSILFSLGGFINAIYANSFDDISIIPTFVLTPLTYLGGVFYSIELLPDFWASVSQINPVLYMVNAFRYGILGVSDINVGLAFAVIVAFIVALFSFCLYLLNTGKGIRK